MPDSLKAELQHGLVLLGLDPDTHPCDDYLSYIELLGQWNKHYNLIASATPMQILTRHILDALAIIPFIHGQRCLDVGTGAGLPGLILALADRSQHWILLDSRGKRIRFLRQIKLELQIENIQLVHSRVEDFVPDIGFSSITCRAFASLSQIYTSCHRLLANNGRILAMKGDDPAPECAALSAPLSTTIYPLHIPGGTRPRTLVELASQ